MKTTQINATTLIKTLAIRKAKPVIRCKRCGEFIIRTRSNSRSSFCDACQNAFNRYDDMMADAAWLGHTF